jgi:hypothetical protein
MDALQLETVAPVSFGGGPLGYYFVTLQSSGGGPASTGSMTVNNGTFSSSLDVFFDIRYGSLSGPIVAASDTLLVDPGSPWSHTAPPGSVLIPGVNYDLNGTDTSADFFPGPGLHNGPHEVNAAAVPDATSTLTLLLMPLGLFAICAARGKAVRA